MTTAASSSQARALLLEAASRLFAEGVTEEVQESVESGDFPRALWSAVEDNGLPLALVPEESGGVGLELADAVAVLRLAGAFALPLPLAETMIGQWALARAGLDVAEGPLALLPAAPRDETALAPSGARTLSVRAPRVPWAIPGHACVVLCDGGAGNGDTVVRLVLDARHVTPRRSPAGEPRGELVLEGHPLDGSAVAPAPAGTADLAFQLYATARAAQMAGALERVLDLTLEHAQGRIQFGKPIGRFQAVQQHVARLAGESAIVGAAVEAATEALAGALRGGADAPGGGDPSAASFAVAAAKARASAAAEPACAIAHQVHAAIGFTREHVLHRFTRRLWSWRDEAGSESHWRERAGAEILAAGPELWTPICGE